MVLEKFFVSKDEFIIRPVHDFGFKILFGHSSDPDCVLLKSFLEAIFEKKYEIIEFKDRQITPIQVFGKEVRLDLRLMCNDEECNLEMQMFLTGSEGERLVFYLSQSIADMEMKGKSYHQLPLIKQVFILAEDTDLAEFGVNEYMFQNTTSHTVLTSNVKAYMINLVKIIESITDAQHMTLLQKWAVFLYYGHLSEHELVKVLMKDQVFRKAAEIMRIVNNDEELKDMAFARMKREMDQITRLENAKKQGFLEGKIEGREEGIESERLETIQRLCEVNAGIEIISAATKLSEDEIKKMIQDHKIKYSY